MAQGWAVGIWVLVAIGFVIALAKPRPIGSSPALYRLSLISILIVVIWVSAWNWPVADDWCSAQAGRDLGPWGFARESYLHWNGRITSSLLGACAGQDPVLAVRLFPLLLSAVLAWGSAWALRGSWPSSSAAMRWWTAGGLLATWVVGMEWPAHGLFWFSATANYAIGLPLLMLLVGASAVEAGLGRWWICAIPVCGGLIIGGLAESFAVATGVWSGCCWLGSRVPSRSRFWFLVCVGLSVGLCVNIFAPGTSERAAILNDHDGFSTGASGRLPLTTAMPSWLIHSAGQIWRWVANPFLWLGVAAFAPVAGAMSRTRRSAPVCSRWRLACVWLLPAAIVVGGDLPAFVLTGHAPPWRARVAIQGVAFLAFLNAVIHAAEYLRHHHPQRSSRDLLALISAMAGLSALAAILDLKPATGFTAMAWLTLALFAGLAWWRHQHLGASAIRRPTVGLYAMSLLLVSWFPSFVIDATVLGPRWTAYQEDVRSRLQSSRGDVIIPADRWSDRPALLWYWGLGNDPGTWRNRAVARWYGVASVRVDRDDDGRE